VVGPDLEDLRDNVDMEGGGLAVLNGDSSTRLYSSIPVCCLDDPTARSIIPRALDVCHTDELTLILVS
jgi:hypothetical protein